MSYWKDRSIDYNRARFRWIPVGRDSVLECASVLALSSWQSRLVTKKAPRHWRTPKRCRAQLALFSIQTQMVLWSILFAPFLPVRLSSFGDEFAVLFHAMHAEQFKFKLRNEFV